MKKLLLKAGATEDQIVVVQGTLDDPKTLDALIKNTVEKFKRIDVLVSLCSLTAWPNKYIIGVLRWDRSPPDA